MENKDLYSQVCSLKNLILAYKKARKGKSKKKDVLAFEENLAYNLKILHEELENQNYLPKPLKTFILRDPKTRKISKSDFRDRVVHHAIIHVIEPLFEKSFIYDSCANRKGKGTLFAITRFDTFNRKVTNNLKSEAFCLKADIRHYFQEVNHEILINLLRRKIIDEKLVLLINKILKNFKNKDKGMPLGNLTSQFFANVYLNALDYFVKHYLRVKYYIRYVDDFIILHKSKKQTENWKKQIDNFLRGKLKLELHPDKSKILSSSNGIDFVGFRNFWHYRLLRKRNINKILVKINLYKQGELGKEQLLESFQGWNAYAKWANSYKLRKKIIKKIYSK